MVAGREWRQLTDTTYVTWNEVAAVCPTDGATTCSGSILRSQDGALIGVTGWTWARSSDVQALFEAIIQPATTNFPTETSTYTIADDPDIARALSGAPDGFEPTRIDAAGRYSYGLTATTSAASPDAANRPGVRDAIPGNSDWVNLATTLPKTSRQSYTGAWLFRTAGGSLDLQSLSLKSTEVAGCKSVIGTVTLTAPAARAAADGHAVGDRERDRGAVALRGPPSSGPAPVSASRLTGGGPGRDGGAKSQRPCAAPRPCRSSPT